MLWLYVLNLGIAFEAGLYESGIAVPQWLSYTPEAGYRRLGPGSMQMVFGVSFR